MTTAELIMHNITATVVMQHKPWNWGLKQTAAVGARETAVCLLSSNRYKEDWMVSCWVRGSAVHQDLVQTDAAWSM